MPDLLQPKPPPHASTRSRFRCKILVAAWNGCACVLAGRSVIRQIYREMALLYHVKKCMIRHTDKCQNAAVAHQNIQLFAAFSSTAITLKWCYKHVLFMAEISSSSLAKKAGALDEEQRGFQTVTAPAPPLALRTWPAGSPQGRRESRNKSRAWLMSARRNRKWIKWDSGWQKRREIRGPSSPQHLGSSCWWTGGPRVLSGLDCL